MGHGNGLGAAQKGLKGGQDGDKGDSAVATLSSRMAALRMGFKTAHEVWTNIWCELKESVG